MPELVTPHGRCAIVALPEAAIDTALSRLPDPERAHAATLSETRRRDFVAGRTALHALVGPAIAVTASDRGGPLVAGWTCSISHKAVLDPPQAAAPGRSPPPARLVAAALAAAPTAGFVGIDLEHARAPRIDIARRILTPREPRVEGAALLRVFALKEAIYKAIDPIVRRFVGFLEVEIAADGTVTTELPVAIEAWAIEHDGYWLATARARPR